MEDSIAQLIVDTLVFNLLLSLAINNMNKGKTLKNHSAQMILATRIIKQMLTVVKLGRSSMRIQDNLKVRRYLKKILFSYYFKLNELENKI